MRVFLFGSPTSARTIRFPGHNFFDADLVRVLEEVGAGRGRASYVLMERLRPRVERNVLLRRDTPPEPCDVVGELGVFGAYIR